MGGTLARVVLAVVAGAGVVGAAFAWAFRVRFQPVLTGIRRMNRTVINPRQLRTAGQPGAYASVIHHVGRRSGTPYRTPVVAVPVEDGFAVVLPYGPGTDWARNVLAAGEATLEHEGREVPVERPEVVPIAEVSGALSPGDRRSNRLFGIDRALRLRSTYPVGAS